MPCPLTDVEAVTHVGTYASARSAAGRLRAAARVSVFVAAADKDHGVADWSPLRRLLADADERLTVSWSELDAPLNPKIPKSAASRRPRQFRCRHGEVRLPGHTPDVWSSEVPRSEGLWAMGMPLPVRFHGPRPEFRRVRTGYPGSLPRRTTVASGARFPILGRRNGPRGLVLPPTG